MLGRPARASLGLLATLLLWLVSPPSMARATEIVAGPVIGHVTDSSARVWLQINTTERVTLRAVDVDTRRTASAVSADVEGPAPFICDVPVNSLEPNRNYRIEVLFDGKPVDLPGGALIVRSAPPPSDPATFAVAFGSTVDPAERLPVFKAIEETRPRAFFFLGDTGLLPAKEDDFPKTRREAFRFYCNFYKKTRNTPELQRVFRNMPTYGLWGERDFAAMGAGKDWIYAQESLVAFQRFWPNPEYGTADQPGIYNTFGLGDVDFFLLDDRLARESADATRSMLGAGQLAWLKREIKSSRATFKVILTSGGALGEGDWGRFKAERDGFVDYLFENRIGGVVFVSGGRQHGQIRLRKPAKGQYPLYEISSSPLGGKVQKAEADPAAIGDTVEETNFGTLEFGGGSKAKRFVTLQLRDERGKVKAEKTVFAGELTGG